MMDQEDDAKEIINFAAAYVNNEEYEASEQSNEDVTESDNIVFMNFENGEWADSESDDDYSEIVFPSDNTATTNCPKNEQGSRASFDGNNLVITFAEKPPHEAFNIPDNSNDNEDIIFVATDEIEWTIPDKDYESSAVSNSTSTTSNGPSGERKSVADSCFGYVGTDIESVTSSMCVHDASYASIKTPNESEKKAFQLMAEYVRAGNSIAVRLYDNDATVSSCLVACGAAILHPYQLLFGWKKKAPWACHIYEIQRWCRLFSAKAEKPAIPDLSSIKTALTFLRRTLDQALDRLPLGLVNRIRRAVIDMDQQRPARTKRIIGIRVSPNDKPMPRSNWKDCLDLKKLLIKAESYKCKGLLVSTDEASDRVAQLERVVTSYYARRYGLNEKRMRAFAADTGSQFQKIHPARIAFIALTAVAQRGQDVLLPLPDYGQLSEWLEVFQFTNGITPRYYHLDPNHSWRLNLSELEEIVTKDVGAFFLCNPAFMCGGVNSGRELELLMQLLARKNVPLVVNEMLDYLVYEQDKRMHSPLEFKPRVPVIIINSTNRWMTFGAEGLPLAWALVYDPKDQLPSRIENELKTIRPVESPRGQTFLPRPSVLAASLYHTGWPGDISRYLAENAEIAVGILKHTPGLRVIQPKASYFVVCMLELRENFDAFDEQFRDDVDFVTALFKEESVKVFCGSIILGWPDCFAIDMYVRRKLLGAQCRRIDEFCRRHLDPRLLARDGRVVAYMSSDGYYTLK